MNNEKSTNNQTNSNKLEAITGLINSTIINNTITGLISSELEGVYIFIDDYAFSLQIIKQENKFSFSLSIPHTFFDNKVHTVKLATLIKILDSKEFLLSKTTKIEEYQSNKILSAIYENSYYKNINRSFKQVLSSKLYPLSLLLHKDKFGGFKNTLVTIKGYNAIRKSELFDVGYYLNNNVSVRKDGMDVILHYLYFGYDKGFKPSKYFNPSEYLSLNSDIKLNGMNPLVHYLLYGQYENRKLISLKNMFKNDKKVSNNKTNTKLKTHKSQKISEKQKNIINTIANDNKLNVIPKTETPLISIIITTHNGRNHLNRLLSKFRILKEYTNYEIIIWDNASTDDSIDLINSFNDLNIILIKNNKNETFSKANNQAVHKANGDYLLFLNNDVEPLEGFMNQLMDTMLNYENVGCVGARLIYPDCSSSTINNKKSYTIQHEGIIFKPLDFIKPMNKNNGKKYYKKINQKSEKIVAVTAACLLIKKSVFLEVNGFSEEYVYGYEDVDLCLKIYKKGYNNYLNSNAVLYHYEFGTQEKDDDVIVKKRRSVNHKIFLDKWNNYLKKELFKDLMNNTRILSNRSLTIAFAVTEAEKDTTAGDYFTALSLSESLKKYGWNIRYLERKKNNWYDIPQDVDVVISLLDSYDISKIKSNNKFLIKIAWLRNWFERWCNFSYFKDYDIILASSKKACDYIEETGKNAILYQIATDNNMFNENIKPQQEYECDYCFTGSYWDAKREIINFLEPSNINYKFKLYGANWNKIDKFKPYHQGFINYKQVPQIYASTKIVIDDANHVTKEWGSVNSRVFDAISSGKLIITNNKIGNNEVFNNILPEYHSSEELTNQINYYLSNDNKRIEKIKQLKEIVTNNHTYKHRAEKLKFILENYIKNEE